MQQAWSSWKPVEGLGLARTQLTSESLKNASQRCLILAIAAQQSIYSFPVYSYLSNPTDPIGKNQDSAMLFLRYIADYCIAATLLTQGTFCSGNGHAQTSASTATLLGGRASRSLAGSCC
jgi:hypothetical protein